MGQLRSGAACFHKSKGDRGDIGSNDDDSMKTGTSRADKTDKMKVIPSYVSTDV